MDINDRIARDSGPVLTVVALTDNPKRVWVVKRLDHGLVMGNGFVIDLEGYSVIKP
jgi:hypothetical protein